MQTDNPAVRERTGYALFDDRQVLVDANAEIFGGNAPARADFPKMDLVAVVAKILPYFERFDGLAVEPTDKFARARRAALATRQCVCRSRRRPSTATGSCSPATPGRTAALPWSAPT